MTRSFLFLSLAATPAVAASVEKNSPKPHKTSFALVLDAAGLQILRPDGTRSAAVMRCAP
ncbi:hypothetical protein ACNHKD_10630 [Methylocystis sp. JAN1]|uniref:hypothetical protein n=1 Tax=Methylocystis sp. JAN1 TaxID=3397211 RepID=UPI003FA28AC5